MHLKTCLIIYSVHLKSVFIKCGLYVSFQRHRGLASHIIWIKSQSPWRTMPSTQHSHLPLTSFPTTLPPTAQHQLWAPHCSQLQTFASRRFCTPDFYITLPSPRNFWLPLRYCPHSEANPSHSKYKCTLPTPTPTSGPFICLRCMDHPPACSLLSRSEVEPRICISNQFPGDVNAAGPRTKLWVQGINYNLYPVDSH